MNCPPSDETNASEEAVRQSPNLSFCSLKERLIVLDPNQGIYFSLSAELSSLLQSLPHQSPSDQSCRKAASGIVNMKASGPSTERQFHLLNALSLAGLVSGLKTDTFSGPASCVAHEDLKIWGTLEELTQSGMGSGTSVGGPPAGTIPPGF